MDFAFSDTNKLYNYSHTNSKTPNPDSFKLHNHLDTNEILVFLHGNSEFHAEGSVYPLMPFDVVIAHSMEMHKMRHIEPSTYYERIVIHIHDRFFATYDCMKLKALFDSRPIGMNNLFSNDLPNHNRIIETIKSIEDILTTDNDVMEVVIRSKLISLLYELNKASASTDTITLHKPRANEILTYINNNITSPLTLDSIAKNFYISKYYLCHIFKTEVGYSINEYLIHKRLLIARGLYLEGKNLLQASLEAGFANYSNFYKAYKKEFGKSPKEGLK